MPFRVAISGLKAASADLSVIGNNIANANTTGFKQSRAEFGDVYATSTAGGSANQIGSGVRLERVAQQFSQGNISSTNNNLDLAISGHGFFALDDNGARVYSRSGAFGVDRNGYVVNAKGQRLVTYKADASGNVTGATGPLQIDTSNISPKVTSSVTAGLNLDAGATAPTVAFDPANASSYNNSTSLTIYDSLGNSHLATLYYRKTAANTWNTYTYVDGSQVSGPDTLTFSSAGTLTSPSGGTVTTSSFTPAGAAPMTLSLDYSGATQYGSPFGVNKLSQNGYTTGQLSGIDIDSKGVVFARFTNGQSAVQGQVALANFANPQGLQSLGDTNWAETYQSGAALMGAPGSASLGTLQSGALEGSNVDLSSQLVNMIVAQRNFQANAQVITTDNTVTQAIINIR